MSNHEEQGIGYDSGARGHELQGRRTADDEIADLRQQLKLRTTERDYQIRLADQLSARINALAAQVENAGKKLPELDKPRRHIVVLAKLEADDWKTLQGDLRHLDREISRHGCLPASSCSGGYSSGHIIVSSVDESMDHDKWFQELNEYLERLKVEEAARLTSTDLPHG